MGKPDHAAWQCPEDAAATTDSDELVMGLHWEPRQGAQGYVADLDAACIVFDAQGRTLDVVHPGHLRSADGSVVHTGDSQTGGAAWDNERIFVFLEALSTEVSALAFVVVNVTSGAAGRIAGASCHVSDRRSGRERVRIDLSTLGASGACCVALLCRSRLGWQISPEPQVDEHVLMEIRNTMQVSKRGLS